jgi:hypothetical protein
MANNRQQSIDRHAKYNELLFNSVEQSIFAHQWEKKKEDRRQNRTLSNFLALTDFMGQPLNSMPLPRKGGMFVDVRLQKVLEFLIFAFCLLPFDFLLPAFNLQPSDL